jgi:hypothetical protein
VNWSLRRRHQSAAPLFHRGIGQSVETSGGCRSTRRADAAMFDMIAPAFQRDLRGVHRDARFGRLGGTSSDMADLRRDIRLDRKDLRHDRRDLFFDPGY